MPEPDRSPNSASPATMGAAAWNGMPSRPAARRTSTGPNGSADASCSSLPRLPWQTRQLPGEAVLDPARQW